jgi:AmpD protein
MASRAGRAQARGGSSMTPPAGGWVSGATRLVSPNCDARPENCAIELLVLHCISLPPGLYGGGNIERLFTNRLDADAHPAFAPLAGARLSAHFLISRAGILTQFVSCDARAWHAGASRLDGRPRCNDFSIGIELEGSEFEPFTAAQYATLEPLQRTLWAAYPLRWARGHSEIAPQRKTDPGPLFDWSRVRRD